MRWAGSAAVRGAAAMAAALATAFAVSTFVPSAAYPPAMMASIIIDLTPGDIATAMIEALGHNALRGLSWGVNIGVLVAGGLFANHIDKGSTAAAKARRALSGAAAMFLGAGAIAIFSPQGASIVGIATYLGASLIYGRYALGGPLISAIEPGRTEGNEMPLDAINRSRRRFVVRTAAIAGVVLVGGVAALKRVGRQAAVALRIAPADVPWVPPPDDAAFPEVRGLTPEITDNASFYNVDINIVKPSVDHTTWELAIDGLVTSGYSLTYEALQSDFEVVELAHTLTCISNEVGGDLISTAVWRGVRLADVLQRAGLAPGVVDIVFRATEGYSDSIPVAKALEPTTLIAFGMNGVALPREHGFPARIIVPGIYGMKNVKWLTRIEAVDHDYQGYWMVRGWSDRAEIKTGSRIDVPSDGAEPSRSEKLGGIAWAGDRGISSVEVSWDGGKTWKQATMKRELSPVAWRLWSSELDGLDGKKKVLVRATDGRGEVQTAQRAKPHPDGASGLDSAIFTVK